MKVGGVAKTSRHHSSLQREFISPKIKIRVSQAAAEEKLLFSLIGLLAEKGRGLHVKRNLDIYVPGTKCQ